VLKRNKITIVGAGNVGATAAHWAASKELGDIVLVDVVEGVPQGKALDLAQAGPIEGFDVSITGTNGYDETEGSDVVVITAGIARKPGMSRDDLLKTNYEIVSSVVREICSRSPDAYIIVVSKPVDVMTYVAVKEGGFSRNQVMGQAGVLDSTRFRAFLAMELGVSVEDVSAFVMGAHGDSMVPLVRYSYAGGIPVERLIPKERLDAIVERTRKGGGEIVDLLKTGSAFVAPAVATIEMVEAILLDERRILPCAAYLEGQYGVDGGYVGVPLRLGAGGIQEIYDISLSDDEKAAMKVAGDAVKELVAATPKG